MNMNRRHGLSLALAVPLGFVLPARAQVTVEGYTFAREVQVAGQALRLNGVGLRAVAWLKGYATGLYLNAKAGTPQAVLGNTGAKRLQLRLLQEVPAEEFVKAFDKGVSRNTPAAELPALKDRMTRFNALVMGLVKVKKGDVVDLDWLPDSGLQFSHNGRVLGAPIAGADLYGALLRIFVGPRPVDPEMKTGLLGGPVG
ncbi:MAG: chalcone isomerase family protein [Rubrivivax sp.]|nr:chalcone isomerase family protein [Rubrivivax sp.]